MFLRFTGFKYISASAAGAIIKGHLKADTKVVNALSANPWANFAIVFTVAGAMTIKSAH